MTMSIPEKVKHLYTNFDQQMLAGLSDIYRNDIVFQDPLHHITGLANLSSYYQGMLDGLESCRFEFTQQLVEEALDSKDSHAVLFWTMHYQHKKIAQGKPLSITGNSHIRYDDKVFYHRDYFDAGAMLYEHLPIMGFVIKQIKKRMEV